MLPSHHAKRSSSLAAISLAIGALLLAACHDDDIPESPDCGVAHATSGGKGGNATGGKGGGGKGGAPVVDAGEEDAGTDPTDAGADSGNGSGGNGSGGNGSGGNGSGGNGSGGNGSGGNGSGGTSGNDAGAGLGDPPQCAPCEEEEPTSGWTCAGIRDECLSATGNAAGGLKQGAPKSELCRDVLACFYQNHCLDLYSGYADCLCGDGADPSTCVSGMVEANGPCKDEILAAAEITPAEFTAGKLSTQADAVEFASGLALHVVNCDFLVCPLECGLCTPEAGSGPEGDANCHPRMAPDGGI